MKKQIIAAAIAAAVAAPAAMAGAPTVYGQLNMSVDQLSIKDVNGDKIKSKSGAFVSSNASRLGVKGSEDLGNGLKAIYKIEFGVAVDNANKTSVSVNSSTSTTDANGDGYVDNPDKTKVSNQTITPRNAYVGLAGSFGTVLLGRHDTPFKMAQPTDTFNDGYGDNKPMAEGLGFGNAGGEVRASNVLAYVSPSFNGIKFVGALVPNEGNAQKSDGTAKESALTDIYSLAVMYGSKKKGLYLGGAYNNFSNVQTVGTRQKDVTETRLAAQYTMGALMANVMYQAFDVAGGTKEANEGSNWQANVGYTIGAATLKAKYSAVDYKNSTQKDGSGYGLGVDYSLGKKTTAYVEYVGLDNVGGAKKVDNSYLSLGLLHKF